MNDSLSLNIGSFSRSVAANSGKVVLQPSSEFSLDSFVKGFSSKDEPSSEKSVEKRIGVPVSLEFMFNKLVERGHLSSEERDSLKSQVKTKEDLAKEVSKLRGLGDASANADNLAYGVMLPNGIICSPDDRKSIERMSKLSREDVLLMEKVTGCDYSAGDGHFQLSMLARAREQGLINGQLGLKDFSVLKFVLDLNIPEGEAETALMKERIQKLYDALSENDASTGSAWQRQENPHGGGLESIKF